MKLKSHKSYFAMFFSIVGGRDHTSTIAAVSSDSFHEKILHSDTPVVVEFFSHSCPHCTKFKPVYQELSKDLAEEARFFKMDVELNDENREFAHSRGVHTVPTVEVFYRGRVIGSITGYHHIKKILDAVKESLTRKDEYIGPGTILQEPQTKKAKEREIKLSLAKCQVRWCKKAKITNTDKQNMIKKLKSMSRMIEEAMHYTKEKALENAVEEVRFSLIPGAYAVIEYCQDTWHLGLETFNEYLGEVVAKEPPLICMLEDNTVKTEKIG